MSLQHFYLTTQVVAEEDPEGFTLDLSLEDRKHLRVLRVAPGEHFALVDAAQDYVEVEYLRTEGDFPFVLVTQHLSAPMLPKVTLVQGLSKGDKIDTVIRGAVEVGVEDVIIAAFRRSVVRLEKDKITQKLSRWQAIAKSAAMQSGRTHLSGVAYCSSCDDLCARLAEFDCVIVCFEECRNDATLRAALSCAFPQGVPTEAKIALCVGPEGGFDPREVDAMLTACAKSCAITLGPTILRTETAGIIAPALVLYELHYGLSPAATQDEGRCL